jgi:molybdate transport system ATP-binding protein
MSFIVRIKKYVSQNFSLDIEFETHDNICLGILGTSGCGKSMTLKCIAGIEKPDEGYIALNGKVLYDSEKKINLKAQERKTGYLFQNYALFPKMTAYQNITVPLKLSKKENQIRSRYWIEKFGLSGLEKSFPHQLSGGQQQRTALARMLICEPDAVLLDEPFSALDSNLREYMQLEFLNLMSGTAFQNMILVTHSRDEVYRLCPELVIIDKGRIVSKGGTRTIFDKPDSVISAEKTGCKNISKIIRRGRREIYALDWGIALKTAEEVSDDITHVGIRAHSLIPHTPGNKTETIAAAACDGFNTARIHNPKKSSGPFEDIVVFTNADSKEKSGRGEIWWKFNRDTITDNFEAIPEKLFFPPESLLLLRG